MRLLRRQFLQLILGTATLLGASYLALAQTYPTRPITMIVPYPAGGPTDVIGRLIAEYARASLDQPVIVENLPGASGSVGTGRVARAAPDGYTIGIGQSTTHVVNGAVYNLQYDVLNDFEPVALLADNPLVIVARKSMPATDLKELIVWLKANKATLSVSGAGGSSHVAGVLFEQMTGVRLQSVFYRGSAQAMGDLLAGHIDMMIDQAANSLPQAQAGKINVYAVTANKRLTAAPQIPTVDEAGLPGFYTSLWHGLWVPKGTPKDIVGKLNGVIVEALADSTVRQRLAHLGQEIFPRAQQTPEALAAFQKAEIEKWWPIIKAAGIKAQ